MLSLQIYSNGLATGVEPAAWIQALTGIHFLMMATIMFAMCLTVHIVVSLLTPEPSEEQVKNYTWDNAIITEETEELKKLPWYENFRILAVLLLVLTAIIVGWLA